ncbi:hypothetical protein KP509_14G029500 [Ceratopteris richardii]|uniref:Uncharacterized protein n=1 Tax=Ceratopteris richardii TaxID=49495 RepID=A0A8T2TBN2_CERRI|nr:hypothetical protein KP509_14G029500 [Ceratopteris richardii]
MVDSDELKPLLLADGTNGVYCEEQLESKLQTSDWRGRPIAIRNGKLGGKRSIIFTTGSICLWYTGFFGILYNLVFFFGDVFNEGSGLAANDTNNWVGSMFLASLLGAFVSESSLGRLWTCTLFQGIATMGMILMVISIYMVLSVETVPSTSKSFFFVSIYLLSIGTGAAQPTLQSLGADQFDTEKDKATFFTWYLILCNVGMVLAVTLVVYIVSAKGWLIGFGMVAVIGSAGFFLFVSGIPLYRQYKHRGNPYQRALQVLVAAARKWRIKSPSSSEDLYEVQDALGSKYSIKHTVGLRWLDKAAIVIPCADNDNGARNVWKLSTVTEVEEVKAVLRLIPIWATSILYSTLYTQSSTLLIEQGAVMDLTVAGDFVMEPATMNLFNLLIVVFIAPVYNAIIVPLARSITGLPQGLSSLQRCGIGYLVSAVGMILAGALETYRLHCFKQGLPLISIFWQTPVYLIIGFAQFLAGIGMMEFFYTYSPLPLRSLGMSLAATCTALGTYVSTILVSIVTVVTTRDGATGWIPKDLNDGHLDYFFWLLGGIALVNLCLFTGCSTVFMRHQSSCRR